MKENRERRYRKFMKRVHCNRQTFWIYVNAPLITKLHEVTSVNEVEDERSNIVTKINRIAGEALSMKSKKY